MKKYKKNLGVMLAKLNDKFIVQKGNDFFEVNEVAARILDLCNGKNTEEQIVVTLSEFYDVDTNEIYEVIKEFIENLLNIELIREM